MEIIHVAESDEDKDMLFVTWLISKEEFNTLMEEAKMEVETDEDQVQIDK